MKPPWIQKPNKLVSWFEMNRFNNGELLKILEALALAPERGQELLELGAIEHGDHWVLTKPLEFLEKELRAMGMAAEAATVAATRSTMQDPRKFSEFKPRIETLRTMIANRMGEFAFYAVPAERAAWLSKTPADLLGPSYAIHYPVASLHDDLTEAVKGYAFGQGTACAFHLMRTYEAPIRALAKALAFTEPPHLWTWEKMAQHCASKAPGHDKEEQIKQAAQNFRTVAHKWRNATMHCEESYTPDQAQALLLVIPPLVRGLVELVREDGTFV